MRKFLLQVDAEAGNIKVSEVNQGFKVLKVTGSFGEIDLWSSKWELDYEEITEEEAIRRGIPLANYGVYDEMREQETEEAKMREAELRYAQYKARKGKG